ncbi:MAG: B12-binding domain-containing radical SAM protein, partial [bacterium]|nr:B12-binding domain-containing radical SAM protein [bacterium]
FERHTLHTFIKGIRKEAPRALVVGGGPYFTATAAECLEQLPEMDVVVRGEGEKTFLELVRAVDNEKNFNNLKGITYRNSAGEIVAKENNSPCNRDDCEIDLDMIPNDDTYSPFVYLKNFEQEKVKAVPILLARGCTMKCTFCFNNNNGRFLSRTVGSVVAEIKAKRERFNCDYFWFVDPTFTLRERFARKLCKELTGQCPGIKWYCETRADCNPELLKEMAGAGCISIDVALESGSPKVLKRILKDLDPQSLFPFTRLSSQLGIRVLVFVMYGMPEETYREFRKTMAVLKKIKPYIYTISYNETLILPGTRLEVEAKNEKIIPPGFFWFLL